MQRADEIPALVSRIFCLASISCRENGAPVFGNFPPGAAGHSAF